MYIYIYIFILHNTSHSMTKYAWSQIMYSNDTAYIGGFMLSFLYYFYVFSPSDIICLSWKWERALHSQLWR